MSTTPDLRQRQTRSAVRLREVDLGLDRRTLRARNVARQLMELHRLSSGVERPEPREFDLVAFARRVLRDYRDAAIVTDAAEVTFCTDSRRLATVLFAVLDNAALHGRAPIRVAVAPGEIVVSDSGGGFSPRLLTEATRPFTTGSRVSGQGVGLGLAIASVQMSILGGTLTVENDSGARVTLTLRGQRPLPD